VVAAVVAAVQLVLLLAVVVVVDLSQVRELLVRQLTRSKLVRQVQVVWLAEAD